MSDGLTEPDADEDVVVLDGQGDRWVRDESGAWYVKGGPSWQRHVAWSFVVESYGVRVYVPRRDSVSGSGDADREKAQR